MNHLQYIIYLLIMAGTTYVIRAVPFACITKKIQNSYAKAFLDYIPYTVLAAMTFPAIFYSTTYPIAAVAGCIVAIILAYFRQSLIRVAIAACATVFLVEAILR